MRNLKVAAIILLVTFIVNASMAQMIRNKAIHFSRHRVVHHHHKK